MTMAMTKQNKEYLEQMDIVLQEFKKLSPILVVGDVGIDKYTYGYVNRISPEAPVSILEVSHEQFKLGLAANVTNNLLSWGVPSTLCGIVGDDPNAQVFENLLEERQLKTWGLVHEPSRKTTLKQRIVTDVQQICRVDYETRKPINVKSIQSIKTRIRDFAKDHQGVIIEDYGKGLCSEELCQYVIDTFIAAGKKVFVDPGRETPPIYYKGATLLKPNLLEAKALVSFWGYREDNPQELTKILMDKLDLDYCVVTLGAAGMAIRERNNGLDLVIPTLAKEVYDVSGAGDTSIAALSASILAMDGLKDILAPSLLRACWIANCASSNVVSKKGTATCTLDEIRQIYLMSQGEYHSHNQALQSSLSL